MVRLGRRTAPPPPPPPHSRWSRSWRRALWGALHTVRWLLLAAALGAGVFLVSGTVRGRVLQASLELGREALPGVITFGELSWPQLNHLQVTDLVWRESRDATGRLAEVPRLDLWVDLNALRLSDVRLDSLRAVVDWLDVPGIARTLAASPAAPRDSAAPRTGPDREFPRAGSLASVPSLAIADWRLEVAAAALTPDFSLADLDGSGLLEAGHGHQPRAVLDHLGLSLTSRAGVLPGRDPLVVSLQHLGLGVSLETSEEAGRGGQVIGGSLDSLRVQLVFAEAAGLHHLLPGALSAADLPPAVLDAGVFGLQMEGEVLNDTLSLAVDLDLSENGWPAAGRLKARVRGSLTDLRTGRLQTAAVEIDTLTFAALGTSLRAAGVLRDGRLDLVLQALVADARLVRLFRPELEPGTELTLDIRGRAQGAWRQPTVELELGGRVLTPDLKLPRLGLKAYADSARVRVQLDLPEGGQAAGTVVDSLAAVVAFARIGGQAPVGSFVVAGRRGSDRLHFGGQAWPDSLIWPTDGRVQMDSLGGTLGGHRLHLAQPVYLSRVGGEVRGRFDGTVVLPGPADFAAWLPPEFVWDETGPLTGRVQLDAVYAAPHVDLDFDLDLGPTPWLDTARFRGRVAGDLDQVQARSFDGVEATLDTLDLSLLGTALRAQGTLRGGQLELDVHAAAADRQLVAQLRPDLVVATDFAGVAAGRISGALRRPQVGLSLDGSLESPEFATPRLSLQVSATLDSAAVDLRLPQGATLGGAVVDSLDVRLSARRAVGDSVSGSFALRAQRGPDLLALGGRVWADSLGGGRTRRVRLDSLITGSQGKLMWLSQPATLDLGPGRFDVALTPLHFAGEPGAASVGGRADAAGLDLAAEAALTLSGTFLARVLPGGIWTQNGGNNLSFAAAADLSGTRGSPRLGGRVALRLIPRSGGSPLGADLDFSLAPGDTAGLQARLAVVVADSVLVAGQVMVPGHLDSVSGRWRHVPERPARLVIPRQTMPLAPFASLLPANVSVSGLVTVAADLAVDLSGGPGSASADSAAANADGAARVTGLVQAPNLAVRLPNRSRLDLGLDLTLSGPSVDPTLGGRVVVHSGFIRIPEVPRNLHPIEGRPALWSLAGPDTSSGELVEPPAYARPASIGPEVEASAPLPLPKLAVDVDIPGNLRLYGYGLETELAGDLKIDRGYDRKNVARPRIQGTVNTVQGTLKFMNRMFHVASGEIRFLGVVPADPQLDLVLESTVSGILVRILVTGTASNPLIELTSEPDYEEADIMAVLLFGRPLGELDNEQRGGVASDAGAAQQLRQNLAGLAMVFGTSGLQDKVSSRVGVDMIEVGSDSSGDSTLMLGTFINPQLMLKYHQSLEKSGTYFVTVEYTLNRFFRLVSTFGQGGEGSGLELKWSRRY